MAESREEEGLRPAGAAQTSPPALATPRLFSRRRKSKHGETEAWRSQVTLTGWPRTHELKDP